MKFDNSFSVDAPIERAWRVLTDIEQVAQCLPGATLTGRDGDGYLGKVRARVGPVTMEYAGSAAFKELDGDNYRAVIDAKGRDARGAGNAWALVTAQLLPKDGRTLVDVQTEMVISGKAAQFGSGMIREISGKLLLQFASNLEAQLAREHPTDVAATAAEQTPSTEGFAVAAPQAPQEAANHAAAPARQHPADLAAQKPAHAAEVSPLRLTDVAGAAILKRLLPVVVVLAIVAAVLVVVI